MYNEERAKPTPLAVGVAPDPPRSVKVDCLQEREGAVPPAPQRFCKSLSCLALVIVYAP